jgi:CubicO group peptidase (beta-lactamase class C family)
MEVFTQFSKLDAYLDSFYKEKNIPGLGCAAYYRGEGVYEHYAGFSDVENGVPFGADTLFRLYSTTKVITAAAALQLVEKGRCKLGDPLYEYIGEYRNMTVRENGPDGKEIIRPAKNPLTIEHLLSMQGGVVNPSGAIVDRALAAAGGRGSTLAVVRAAAAEPLAFEPGTRFKYSWCMDVLGGLVEVLSGKTLGAYLQENIFEPLGMKDTAFEPGPEDSRRMAKDYVRFNAETGKAERIECPFRLKLGPDYESGGGGLWSTVRDYILFAEALCNGGAGPNGARILKRETIENMRANRQFGQAALDFTAFGGTSKAGYGYGLGVRTLVDREKNNALSANGEFGWDGACGCYAVIDPETRTALFYAQQEAGSEWWFWHGTIRNYLYAGLWKD